MLALGVAIACVLTRRRNRAVETKAALNMLSREWEAHCEAHAKAQAGSLVKTAPEILINGHRAHPFPDMPARFEFH